MEKKSFRVVPLTCERSSDCDQSRASGQKHSYTIDLNRQSSYKELESISCSPQHGQVWRDTKTHHELM